ncbi:MULTISPECIES: FlgO family outer membrane protein [unclassified Comamonas]|uniref:FlgO family outer membrane protein n=1 Tax=unclassified Comamonas TaxID=2638500 RepID=UPI000395C14B|nr:FlgO family outer membrane protein [Comamonas sp. B-9]
MMQRLTTLAAVASAAVLAGCASWMDPAQPVSTVRSEPTYQAADASVFLANSQDAINKLTASVAPQSTGTGPVLVATVVNVNNMGASSPLGRTLSEIYANQMAARGFHVKEVKLRTDLYVREGTGELLLSREMRDIARSQNASMVLVGTFSPAANFTYVSLKLVRTEDSRILSGYDYALPNDRDVTRLLNAPR